MSDTLLRETAPTPGYQPVPKPQYWNPAANNGQGGWEVLEGERGGMFVVRKTARRQDATIPAGQTTSSPVDISTAQWIGLVAPAAMDGTTIGFEVSDSPDGAFHALCGWEAPLDLSLTGRLGKAFSVEPFENLFLPWQQLRIVTTVPQTAQRVFEVHSK